MAAARVWRTVGQALDRQAAMPVTCRARPGAPRAGWTAARRQALVGYVVELAGLLGLVGWDIEIDLTVEASDGSDAEVAVAEGRQAATVWLAAGFLAQSPAWQREAVVHELLHLHVNPLVHTSDAMLDGVVAAKVAQVHRQGLWHAAEARVDALARALAGLLPEPDLL